MTAAQYDEQYVAASVKQARGILEDILGKLVSADDPQFDVLQAVLDASVSAGITFTEAASNLGLDITTDLVAVYLTWIIGKWERGDYFRMGKVNFAPVKSGAEALKTNSPKAAVALTMAMHWPR